MKPGIAGVGFGEGGCSEGCVVGVRVEAKAGRGCTRVCSGAAGKSVVEAGVVVGGRSCRSARVE